LKWKARVAFHSGPSSDSSGSSTTWRPIESQKLALQLYQAFGIRSSITKYFGRQPSQQLRRSSSVISVAKGYKDSFIPAVAKPNQYVSCEDMD
jgi:hypothetical protein